MVASESLAISDGTTNAGCRGWNAEPSDGLNRKPTHGLNTVADDWSASVNLRQTFVFILVGFFEIVVKYKGSLQIKTDLAEWGEIKWVVLTFSQPSGGSRARNRFIRGDAPVTDAAPSSGDVLWLSSAKLNYVLFLYFISYCYWIILC